MQIKILKNIVGTIAGPAAVGIVDLLYGKKNVNEFVIAKKLKLNINQARNILYKLSDEGLVSFVGKKDKKNGGWYTYYWTLDIAKSLVRARDVLVNEIQSAKNSIVSLKSEAFYVCPSCHTEFTEENALLGNFTCPECGEVLQLRDGMPLINEAEKKITMLNEQLIVVQKELGVVEKQQQTIRTRKATVAARKAKVERAAKKALKAKEAGKVKKPKKAGKAKPAGRRS
jgi:transcription initiation factor TFIIE subunit alpha